MATCCGTRMTAEGTFHCPETPVAAYSWDGAPFLYKGKPGAATCAGHESQLLGTQRNYPGLKLVERLDSPRWVKDDGGRAAAGFVGTAGDCLARAVAIVTGKPYREVYDGINGVAKTERRGKRWRSGSSARTGVYTKTARAYVASLGGVWKPLMQVGSGCKVHLRREELPAGRIIARVSKHFVAVVDGVIRDTHDPARGGTRCVYGYWTFPEVTR